MKKYWSAKAAVLTPYVAGEQPKQKLIKLNTNENAYPPSPAVTQAIARKTGDLQLYPNADADGLRQVIAQAEGVSAAQVFCANGSDEALALCFMAFFDPGRAVRTMDVTYSFYPVWAKLFGLTLDIIPLKGDFTVDVSGMAGGKSAVLANPNAPTGIALSPGELEKIVAGTQGVCVVDEAYIAFGGESARPLLEKYDNLAVVRTLSKSHSLAGLRVGYVLASENLVSALFAVKDSFNSYPLDALAQAGAAAAIEDADYYKKTTREIVQTREYVVRELAAMGISCLPSSANFLFVHCPGRAAEVFGKLREHGILVRYFSGGRTGEYLRVSIGLRQDMEVFVQAMRHIWGTP